MPATCVHACRAVPARRSADAAGQPTRGWGWPHHGRAASAIGRRAERRQLVGMRSSRTPSPWTHRVPGRRALRELAAPRGPLRGLQRRPDHRRRRPRGAVATPSHCCGSSRALHLDVEMWANRALQDVPLIALLASYWYAALHYLVTPARAGDRLPPGAAPLPAGAHDARRRQRARAGRLHPAADGAAADAPGLRRHPRLDLRLRAGGAPTPARRRGSAASPTSWPRCRRCTSAGRSGPPGWSSC